MGIETGTALLIGSIITAAAGTTAAVVNADATKRAAKKSADATNAAVAQQEAAADKASRAKTVSEVGGNLAKNRRNRSIQQTMLSDINNAFKPVQPSEPIQQKNLLGQ